jgi:hypothetical protein
MFKTGCCLFLIWLLAIIGVSVDVLLHEHGTSIFAVSDLTADVDYGWNSMSLTYGLEDGSVSNETKVVTYNDAYNDCKASTLYNTTDYCHDLNHLQKIGQVYIVFNILAIISLSVAIALCIIAGFGKIFCKCPMNLKWTISIFIMMSTLFFIIAYSTFWGYSSNLEDVVNTLAFLYFPWAYLTMNWGPAYAAGSIFCLIFCTIFTLMALLILFKIEDAKYDSINNGGYYVYIDNQPPQYGNNTTQQQQQPNYNAATNTTVIVTGEYHNGI